MELLQIKYFKMIADTENISKTAEQLYIAQPQEAVQDDTPFSKFSCVLNIEKIIICIVNRLLKLFNLPNFVLMFHSHNYA